MPNKTLLRRLLAFVITLVFLSACQRSSTPRILVFAKTKGWKHYSIPAGLKALLNLGNANNIDVDTLRDASIFNDDDLKGYNAVVFLNTTGNVLNAEQQAAFERYIQAGGGFVGIHAAACTEYEWPWFGKLVGAFFANHPMNPGVRKGVIEVIDKSHPATAGLPARWEREEEWYSFRNFYAGIKVLATLDENSYEGGTNGSYHPYSWYHEFDGGRSFYTAAGHDDASYTDSLFLQHVLGGIQYAMNHAPLDYSKSYAVPVPEENRFVKTVLVNDLNNPMELAVSDDGKIFFTELRSGKLMMFNQQTSQHSVLHRFNICTRGGTGVIGVTLDPHFKQNHHLYVYYAPATTAEPIYFNLSRFTLTSTFTFDSLSEKILLKVPVQENSGAHHGGSLAWDKDGNLYLSTGDSSSPFPSNGYAPLDERPGAEHYSLDAQRGPSNTNDLKGKILRIHPTADGKYTIPKGNLFPEGTLKTLPEIFAMGCRNPYRIAVNPITNTVYWGEIGPDAGKDSLQGPRGYDEFNQAKRAGNFGWPYFIGNNQPYNHWDFEKNIKRETFDVANPVNNSPNNTGLTKLPAPQPAMVWYPYMASDKFPTLGQGGRSAMAGDFYSYDDQNSSPTKFPKYYDGCLFVFDWMRNWVMTMRFDDNENLKRIEPFMSGNGDFRRPIDIAFGKDGVMYMLEYGSVYGIDNEDARLVRIEYNAGNRAPIACAGIPDTTASSWDKKANLTSERSFPQLNKIVGPCPLKVQFSSSQSKDLDDDDELRFSWTIRGEQFDAANPTYTFTTPGVYYAILNATDQHNASSLDTVVVYAGNTAPAVDILTKDNKSFYFPGQSFRYSVRLSDAEDGSPLPRDAVVKFSYSPNSIAASPDLIAKNKLTQYQEPIHPGQLKMMDSDCKACHTTDKVSVGPSYIRIAQRYQSQPGAIDKLAKKIIMGGGGNWGRDHVMSAHPQINMEDAKEIVRYILSIGDVKLHAQHLPTQGSLNFNHTKESEPFGTYTIQASYTDRGFNNVPPAQAQEVIHLRKNQFRPIDADVYVGIDRWSRDYGVSKHKAYFMLKNIDLTTLTGFDFEYMAPKYDGEIEVRTDSYAGPVIARAKFNKTGWDTTSTTFATIEKPLRERHHLYFIFINRNKPKDELVKVLSVTVKN
ncbi:ThuA domain-containing protein [Pseudochryseolinea flava]|uniref:Glycosyl hydrolase n=1 Tax=Pseudochryseolinea flava TaxID=2059302 RepID=A0A364Y182_9BACT|nr:ThuA domain-containing protein [Pseudochryseolinea flava]RAW00435.1 glycosyl hydrolase [Pseudochryseolinea flava]